ncbi:MULTISPECIES: MBL fold metallo-hydrolase [unclassified Saccharopolyspora]|uniref:MBL fold metallo-hydrolase n=2 Tax=Pseudonocardiaceae TaxID=2070 RepID=UPI00190D17F5|nr:MBL fold metallo-hydrolase [Saccharopolyspora sp. HNM0986]MBK0870035.1 MBL fold metallo-hydrolase [Saccharopolyspora sp. HNM0986]
MKLTILGCSGSLPRPDSPASGYLVESAGSRIVLDLGSGSIGTLQRFADPFALDGLFLTHLHPDHCADFGGLTVLRRYHPDPPFDAREHRLPVFGPPEAADRLARLYAPSSAELGDTDLSDVFEFGGVDEPMRAGAFEVTALPMDHLCPSWGFRVRSEDRVLAYTGDTGPCAELGELARDADVLLAEASWPDAPDRPDGVHLSGAQAGRVAKQAGVRKLLLTHLQPWTDAGEILREATAEFDGPVEVVEAARSYQV